MVKANLGDHFSDHFDNQRWKLNVDSKEFYYGNRWIDFLNNGRVILGSDSGSSEIILNHKNSFLNFINAYIKLSEIQLYYLNSKQITLNILRIYFELH